MTGKRILSFVLSVVLLVSSSVIGVNAAGDSGTTAYVSQMEEHLATWNANGRIGKTTLFIGDSFFAKNYWTNFDEMYAGKDVIRAGISSTTTHDWDYFLDTFLTYTSPKNIVIHLGTNNIHDDGEDAATVTANLQNLFTNMHALEKLSDTQIYYFGIPYKKSTAYGDSAKYSTDVKATVDTVNADMEAWCAERDWIHYLDDLTGGVLTDDQYLDTDLTHLKPETYSVIVDALNGVDVSPEVSVKFARGTVANSGENLDVVVDSYELDKQGDKTNLPENSFVEYSATEIFVEGREGDENGAIVTNHHNGPYTVFQDYALGTADFTISAWFKIPADVQITGSGHYIFGISDPDNDSTAGFSATIKYTAATDSADEKYELRLRNDGTNVFYPISNFSTDKWYHLAMTRTGETLSWYLNGQDTEKIHTNADDFGTADIAFGACTGWKNPYTDSVMYFDDVELYNTCLTTAQVKDIYTQCNILDGGDVTCVVGDANFDEAFDVADLVRLKSYLGGANDDCSMDADCNVSGALNTPDAVRCREMLVGDPALQVTATEDTWYKRLVTEENCYAYYEIKKAVKAGRMITFDIVFPENADYTAYVYYDGCKDWIAVEDEDTTADYIQCKIITPKNISNVRVQVINHAGTEVVSDYTIYNIQVVKDSTLLQEETIDMTLTYAGSTDPIVLYGAGATLDMTKFEVETETEGFTFSWTTNSNELDSSVMSNRAFVFASEVTYTLKAIESITGTVSNSIPIYVLPQPEMKVDYADGAVVNTGTNTDLTVGIYTLSAQADASNTFVAADTATFVAGADGTENSAISTNFNSGAYTVVETYPFETNDFVVSAWINIPSDVVFGSGSGHMILGTMNPDGTSGFTLSLKDQQLRVKVNTKNNWSSSTSSFGQISFERDTWYNVAVQRSGTTLRVLFDGTTVSTFTLNSTDSFGTVDLGCGAYTGWTKTYPEYSLHYDNLMIINNGLNLSKVKALANIRSLEPEVRVDYDDETVTNTGTDSSVTAGSYVMDATTSATKFVETTDVTYAAGVGGTYNKAMTVNHKNGPYMKTGDYDFGTGDFTVSTWFNLEDASKLANDSGHYLLGSVNPNSGIGFNACVKYTGTEYQIRVRGAEQGTQFFPLSEDIESNTWYHLALSRVGSTMYVYFNGAVIGEYTVDSYDFDKKALAIGGYTGFIDHSYANSTTYFDEVEIYGAGLSASQIEEMYTGKNIDLNVAVDFTGGTVTNTGTMSDLLLGTYKFNSPSTMDYFEPSNPVYTNGVAGDEDGALSVVHYNGTYASVKDYVLGTDNFTMSTWFYIPTDHTIGVTGTYLVGNCQPDASEGFSITIKDEEETGCEMRVMVDGEYDMFTLSMNQDDIKGKWYYLSVVRDGGNFHIYLDGELFATKVAQETTDLGVADISIGAYPRFSTPYTEGKDSTYFDGLKIYSAAITSGKIAADMAADQASE